MKNIQAERIRMLLIDDKPEGLWNDREPSLPAHPALPDELRELFELRWIATAGEAREYMDLVRLIGRRDPRRLSEAGAVPEIVVIDYSLTQDQRTVEHRLRPEATDLWLELSPLEPLRQIAQSMQLPLPHQGEQYVSGAVHAANRASESDREGENYGCFVGGLIIAAFADHPCAPVTVTIRQPEQLRGTHTGFFQWLMLTESSGKLAAVGRTGITWNHIAIQAVEFLRRKIDELARVRAISLSILDLLALSGGKEISHLTVSSKYGVRHLPVEGLFRDKPTHQIFTEAKKWAGGSKGLLQQLAGSRCFEDMTAAVELSDTLWREYMNTDRVRDRLALAKLIRELNDQTFSEHEELKKLWGRFSTAPPPTKGELPKSLENFADIRMGNFPVASRRWACLMILVRLLKFRADALAVLEDSDEFGEKGMPGAIRAPLQVDDLYLALFPVAKNPPDLKSKNDLELFLKRWKPPLRINDLIPDSYDEPDNADRDNVESSVSLSDRQIMEWYALSIGFTEEQWGPHAARIIRGRTGVIV